MGIILTPPKSNLSKCIEHIEIWFQVTIWAFIMAISWWRGAGSVAKWWFGCFSCTFLHCINSMWNWESHPKWSLPNVFARWWFSGYIKFQSWWWSEVFNSVIVRCWSLKINKKACQIVTLASVQFNTRCKCIGFNLAMHYSRVIGQPRDLSFDQLQLKVLEQLGSKSFSSFNFCPPLYNILKRTWNIVKSSHVTVWYIIFFPSPRSSIFVKVPVALKKKTTFRCMVLSRSAAPSLLLPAFWGPAAKFGAKITEVISIISRKAAIIAFLMLGHSRSQWS